MKNKIILILIIFYIGCFNNNSEKDLLNKKNPIGTYGKNLSEGYNYNIGELLLSADNYLGKNIKITGIITDVCPMRGCWIEVGDNQAQDKIRIKVVDGEIVFPLSAKGRKIIAEGAFTKLELSKKQAKNWKHHLALEKGIELDTSKIILSQKDYYEYRLNSNAAEIF